MKTHKNIIELFCASCAFLWLEKTINREMKMSKTKNLKLQTANCKLHTKHHRRGITLIEVMTAIVVALIGVFGVMVMVPLAVRQSQVGLDRDAATVAARNAFERFEIEGYQAVDDSGNLRWRLNGHTVNMSIAPDPLDIGGSGNPEMDPVTYANRVTHWGGAVCIDPLGVTENGIARFPFNHFPAAPAAVNQLPDDPTGTPPYDLTIDTVNLTLPNNTPMDIAAARRMFRASDDLIFGDAIESATWSWRCRPQWPTASL